MTGIYLYRWFDAAGVLLYIGITKNPRSREADHWERSWWVRFADRVEVQHPAVSYRHPVAEAHETLAIDAEQPVFNLARAEQPRDRMVSYLLVMGEDPADYEQWLPEPPPPPPPSALERYGIDVSDLARLVDDARKVPDMFDRAAAAQDALTHLEGIIEAAREIRNAEVRELYAQGAGPTELVRRAGVRIDTVKALTRALPRAST